MFACWLFHGIPSWLLTYLALASPGREEEEEARTWAKTGAIRGWVDVDRLPSGETTW